MRCLSSPLFLLAGVLVLECNAFGRLGELDAELKVVPLFTKPAVSTGRLVVMEEGLAVLRAQKEPFAIISAVGPTRTGKSTILGRTFFRDEKSNPFQVGSGVKSFTGGVWITSRPVEIATGSGTLRVLFIDTEGFGGVGSITSNTYEANLFGVVYLLSSAIIYNTMFPVDASTVASLNAHSTHALHMLQALKEGGGEGVKRRKPRLIWAVQSFNMFNLANDAMEAGDLLSTLRNTSKAASKPALHAVLGEAASSSSAWLVEHLFEQQKLVPVRRPHTSDDVVANLAKYDNSKLSKDYMADVEDLRVATTRELQPVHHCVGGEVGLVNEDECITVPWKGEEFVQALDTWIKDGYVVDDSDIDPLDPADETENLFKLGERNRGWLDTQCKELVEDLRNKFYWHRERTTSNHELREEILREASEMMAGFQKAALSRMVESGIFWKYPGKGATLVEQQSTQAVHRCKEQLDETRLYMEGYMVGRDEIMKVGGEATPDVLLKNLQKEHPGTSQELIYKLVAKDSCCHGRSSGRNRLEIGRFPEGVAGCAEAVSKNCECGRGFMYDASNDGYCGCGVAGSVNSDCTEDTDDFCFKSDRYLMLNPNCLNKQDNRRMLEKVDPDGEAEAYAAPPKKARRVCFDVFD